MQKNKTIPQKMFFPIFAVSLLLTSFALNNRRAYAVTDTPTPTETPTFTPTPTATSIYENSTLSGALSCNSLHVDKDHPETCALTSGACVWNDALKKLTCEGTWKARDTYPGRVQYIRPKVIVSGANMTQGMMIGWRNSISSSGNYNVFNYCVDGSGDKGRVGSRLWGSGGSLCFRQVAAMTPEGETRGVDGRVCL